MPQATQEHTPTTGTGTDLHLDAELIRLAREFEAIWEHIRTTDNRTEAELMKLHDARWALEVQIRETPAKTIAGLSAKARVVSKYRDDIESKAQLDLIDEVQRLASINVPAEGPDDEDIEWRKAHTKMIADHAATAEKALLVAAVSLDRVREYAAVVGALDGFTFEPMPYSACFGDAGLFEEYKLRLVEQGKQAAA